MRGDELVELFLIDRAVEARPIAAFRIRLRTDFGVGSSQVEK